MRYEAITEFLKNHNIEFFEEYPTFYLSSFELGGNAKLAVFPKSIEDFCKVLTLAHKEKCRLFVIGNCTNTVFSDSAYYGIVVCTKYLNQISINGNVMRAMCGASITDCSIIAMLKGFSGLEFACGIPGSVGGSVFMNASAFGASVSEAIVKSTVLDLNTGKCYDLNPSEHMFGTKRSVFCDNKNLILLYSEFKLLKSNKAEIKADMKRIILKRICSQPLEYGSCGSTFKRPNGFYASKLIDDAGLKGISFGGAMVSKKHAGFVVNFSDATCSDVLNLLNIIKREVRKKFGISLEEEIIFVE